MATYPYTAGEERVSNLILEAHEAFVDLEQTHPDDIKDWVQAVHSMQKIIGMRILRRDYPEQFSTIKTEK